jgi:hypothetical protein
MDAILISNSVAIYQVPLAVAIHSAFGFFQEVGTFEFTFVL